MTREPEAGNAENPEPQNRKLSKQRLWLFRLLVVSIPLVILLVAEIAFRVIPGLNEDRDPYVNISAVSIFSLNISVPALYCGRNDGPV
jgi:hypothetical protein